MNRKILFVYVVILSLNLTLTYGTEIEDANSNTQARKPFRVPFKWGKRGEVSDEMANSSNDYKSSLSQFCDTISFKLTITQDFARFKNDYPTIYSICFMSRILSESKKKNFQLTEKLFKSPFKWGK
jgi:hypothetical protein